MVIKSLPPNYPMKEIMIISWYYQHPTLSSIPVCAISIEYQCGRCEWKCKIIQARHHPPTIVPGLRQHQRELQQHRGWIFKLHIFINISIVMNFLIFIFSHIVLNYAVLSSYWHPNMRWMKYSPVLYQMPGCHLFV